MIVFYFCFYFTACLLLLNTLCFALCTRRSFETGGSCGVSPQWQSCTCGVYTLP
ncbi:hypothetical protein BDV10DRAFT_179498 [Aspergillus recurvatus]